VTSRWPRKLIMPIRAVPERGPKAKKSVAFAIDPAGWSRGAETVDTARNRGHMGNPGAEDILHD
jgi:hypothetical protein